MDGWCESRKSHKVYVYMHFNCDILFACICEVLNIRVGNAIFVVLYLILDESCVAFQGPDVDAIVGCRIWLDHSYTCKVAQLKSCTYYSVMLSIVLLKNEWFICSIYYYIIYFE